MNNDNIIEEKCVEIETKLPQAILGALEYRGFNDCGKYLDPDIFEHVLPIIRTALLEVDQAGYARAIGEAREKMLRRILPSKYEHLPEHARAGAVFQDCLSCLTPTDNNKEDNPK